MAPNGIAASLPEVRDGVGKAARDRAGVRQPGPRLDGRYGASAEPDDPRFLHRQSVGDDMAMTRRDIPARCGPKSCRFGPRAV